MNKSRISYIQNMNKKTNISWPIITLVSFLIILILIILLLFSHLDTLSTVINYSNIEKEIKDMTVQYESAKIEYDDISDKLYTLKNELVNLNETEGVKLNFYNDMKEVVKLKSDFTNSLYNSLNTRSILKKYGEKIYINKYNNLTFEDSFLFESDSAKNKNDLDDFYLILAKRLYDLLSNDNYKNYIDSVYIISYINKGFDNATLNLSFERATRFKVSLLTASQDLNEYAGKIKIVSGEDTILLYDKIQELERNDRIELVVNLNENKIYDGIKYFTGN